VTIRVLSDSSTRARCLDFKSKNDTCRFVFGVFLAAVTIVVLRPCLAKAATRSKLGQPAIAASATPTPTPAPAATASPSPKIRRFSSDDYLRVYRFFKYYRTGKTDQSAENQSIALNAAYQDPVSGLGAAATYYNADPFGGNTGPPATIDSSLPPTSISTLGVAYAQLDKSGFLLRGGRQIINNPAVNASDSVMVPSTFYGIWTQSPWVSGWQLTASRIYSWKNRDVSTFQTDNLLTNKSTPGILFGLLERTAGDFDLILGQYQFYDTAHLTVFQATQEWSRSKLRPSLGVQYGSENELGSAFAGTIASHVYGAQAKVSAGTLAIKLSYDGAPFDVGTFNHGGPASPYVYSDSDASYTSSIINQMSKNGAGNTYRLELADTFADTHVTALIAQANFLNTPPGATKLNNNFETDLDATYFFSRQPKHGEYRGWGFRIRYAINETAAQPYRQTNLRFQLQYTTHS
jgi:outer membrane porin, OprD family